MAEAVRRFVGWRTGSVVTIMRTRDNAHEDWRYYFACWACGNCSKHHHDEGGIVAKALEHLEDHETGTA